MLGGLRLRPLLQYDNTLFALMNELRRSVLER